MLEEESAVGTRSPEGVWREGFRYALLSAREEK